jgi:hypothetical protein
MLVVAMPSIRAVSAHVYAKRPVPARWGFVVPGPGGPSQRPGPAEAAFGTDALPSGVRSSWMP